MLDRWIEFAFVCTCGVGLLGAAFVVGDILGTAINKAIHWYRFRLDRARYRLAWQDVAATHKRKVKC